MIEDGEMDALREIAGRIRTYAEQSVYGAFDGGDPRDFSPDPECCTPEEYERWQADCAAWERGDHVDRGPSHIPLDATTESTVAAAVVGAEGGWKTVHHYGLGVLTYRDEELTKLAQDLDDWIDRARQVLE